ADPGSAAAGAPRPISPVSVRAAAMVAATALRPCTRWVRDCMSSPPRVRGNSGQASSATAAGRSNIGEHRKFFRSDHPGRDLYPDSLLPHRPGREDLPALPEPHPEPVEGPRATTDASLRPGGCTP